MLPPICPTDQVPEMSPFCEDACIICDIDGFSGRNGRDENFFLPDDFCTQVQHNGKWIGFIAGSENLRVQLSVSNCQLGIGLEIGIYEATDCSNPVSVGSCFGGQNSIPPGSSQIFENTQPLVVGQYYYMVMDGGLDDVCDWEFTVLEGTTEVQPLTTSGPISGPLNVCPNLPVLYETAIETGATIFNWTVDGIFVADGPNPELIWNQEGVFELCVTAANACDEADPFCTQVTVATIPTTIIDTFICSNIPFEFGGQTLTEGGQYNFDFTTVAGCDSNFVLNLTEVQASQQSINLNVCLDDVLELNGETFTESGSYQQILTNRFGCDSTLDITLTFIDCTITAVSSVTGLECSGDTDAEVRFTITGGVPVFFWEFIDLSGNVIADGVLNFLNSERVIPNVPQGQYQISILDQFGDNARIINVIVREPEPISVFAQVSDFNGFPISCFGLRDGSIELEVSGGTAPYNVDWSDNVNGTTRNDLAAGTYDYSVTDANGCTFNSAVVLEQPTEVTAFLVSVNSGCTGPNTGSISVVNPSGGAGGYRFSLDGGPLMTEARFENLGVGTYEIAIVDANGCRSSFVDTLRQAVIPQMTIFEDVVVIPLGSTERIGFNALDAQRVIWTGEPASTIIDSSMNFLTLAPLNSGPLLGTALSADGCAVSDSVRIIVENSRKIYAPNAFSPNADGVNDLFELFPGQSVASIEGLQIFSRWGGLVFEQTTEEPSWDGSEAATGTYVWRAIVVYLNGETELLTGDVTLLR